jgi:hypothetical protein
VWTFGLKNIYTSLEVVFKDTVTFALSKVRASEVFLERIEPPPMAWPSFM